MLQEEGRIVRRGVIFVGSLLLLVGVVLASPVTLDLITDNFGGETSFTLVTAGGFTNIAYDNWSSPTVPSPDAGLDDGEVMGGDLVNATTYQFDWDLAPGDYEFTILDSFGDGICCGFGTGSYTLTVDSVVVEESNVGNNPFTGTSMKTKFSAQIPEPATVSFVALGLGALLIWRRRRTA